MERNDAETVGEPASGKGFKDNHQRVYRLYWEEGMKRLQHSVCQVCELCLVKTIGTAPEPLRISKQKATIRLDAISPHLPCIFFPITYVGVWSFGIQSFGTTLM
jgi:hypothetical protein